MPSHEDLPSGLLAELESLQPPTPNAHYLRVVDGQVHCDLPVELSSFLTRASGMLDRVLADAAPVPVYESEDLAAERIGDLVEMDAVLRSTVSDDFANLSRLLAGASLPASNLPSLMRSLNRLRMAFSGKTDEVAAAGKMLCSLLLADVLELWSFQ
jgi:hypothetical protein